TPTFSTLSLHDALPISLDEAVLRNMGDEALGIVTSCWYSAEIENAINKRFVANFRVDHGYDPGFYAAATYTEAAVLDQTLQKIRSEEHTSELQSRFDLV